MRPNQFSGSSDSLVGPGAGLSGRRETVRDIRDSSTRWDLVIISFSAGVVKIDDKWYLVVRLKEMRAIPGPVNF